MAIDRDQFLYIKISGAPDFWVISLHGQEALSAPFAYSVELLAEGSEVLADALLGQAAGITLLDNDGQPRFLHGLVTSFQPLGWVDTELTASRRGFRFMVQVSPPLWKLSRHSDCRIYQDTTAPDLLKDVLQPLGEPQLKLKASYPALDYCVQYRETTLNFISRIMEAHGIYYAYQHAKEDGKLTLFDGSTAHPESERHPVLRFQQATQNMAAWPNRVTSFAVQQVAQSDTFALRDFDYLNPNVDLSATSHQGRDTHFSGREVYDFPGFYVKQHDGETIARLRREEAQAQTQLAQGTSDCMDIVPGYRFKLTDHPVDSLNGDYLVVSCALSAVNPQGRGGNGAGGSFDCQFTALRAEIPFRPARRTPEPLIHGPQSAVVVGRQGEEIDTDKYGRIKVQFHWDRYGTFNEKSSCWVRVSQAWAGSNWGAFFLPRIGHEVLVSFLEGSPDRPVVTGCVYNALNTPPYALPDNKTQSGIKSRSSKDAGPANFNEIRFEDAKGKEMLTVHAEKDLSTTVENNETRTVLGKRDTSITKDETLEIKEGNRSETIAQGNDSLKVSQGNVTHEAPQGTYTVKAMEIVLDAQTKITLKVGSTTLVMDAASVTIKSTQISSEAEGMLKEKAPMIESQADGMYVLKGGMVMIN